MTTPEHAGRIRPLNEMERQRFVDAVRPLMPPLHPSLFELKEVTEFDMAGNDLQPDTYTGATYRVGDDIIDLSETYPREEPEFHEITAEVIQTSIDTTARLALRHTTTYIVNPSRGQSHFREKVRPIGQPAVPVSNEVFHAKMAEIFRKFQSEEPPIEYTFTPERLAVIMPLIAQCNRSNLIAITDH